MFSEFRRNYIRKLKRISDRSRFVNKDSLLQNFFRIVIIVESKKFLNFAISHRNFYVRFFLPFYPFILKFLEQKMSQKGAAES